jgi:hypothetical protein
MLDVAGPRRLPVTLLICADELCIGQYVALALLARSAISSRLFDRACFISTLAREHRRLMQKGAVVDLLDEEIRHVGP